MEKNHNIYIYFRCIILILIIDTWNEYYFTVVLNKLLISFLEVYVISPNPRHSDKCMIILLLDIFLIIFVSDKIEKCVCALGDFELNRKRITNRHLIVVVLHVTDTHASLNRYGHGRSLETVP